MVFIFLYICSVKEIFCKDAGIVQCPIHNIFYAVLNRNISQTHVLESVIANSIIIVKNTSVEALLLCVPDLLSPCAEY